MALYHKWGVKTGFTIALQFFMLISDGLGDVPPYDTWVTILVIYPNFKGWILSFWEKKLENFWLSLIFFLNLDFRIPVPFSMYISVTSVVEYQLGYKIILILYTLNWYSTTEVMLNLYDLIIHEG